jgi:hypothetical protein
MKRLHYGQITEWHLQIDPNRLTILQRREGEASTKACILVLWKLKTFTSVSDDSYHYYYTVCQEMQLVFKQVNKHWLTQGIHQITQTVVH